MSTPTSTSSTARPLVVAAAVLGWLLVVVMTAGRIRDELVATLHRDEAIAWTYANLPLTDIPQALTFDVNPPVYFMALHTWLAGGGDDAAFLRALSVLAVVASAGVAFDAARRLAGARAGWLASAFVLLAPGTLAIAGLARPYAIAFLLGTVALDAAIAMVKGARWPAVAVFSVSAALLPLTHYWGGLLLVALLTGVGITALLTGQRSLLTRALIATGIVLVALAPWAPTLASQLGNGPLAAHRVPDLYRLGTALTSAAGGQAAAWVVGLSAAGMLTIWWWRRRRSPEPPRPLDPGMRLLVASTIAALAIVVLMWGISQVRPLFTSNYVMIVLAPLPVLVGVVMSRRWWTIAAVLAALAAVALPDFTRSAFADQAEQQDVRGPEAEIGASLEPWLGADDVVLTSPGRVLALRYYLGDVHDYMTPIGRVYDGLFDYRDRVARLESANPAAVTSRLTARDPGTRIAYVHDLGVPVDHPYWIALDDVMDEIRRDLRASESVVLLDSWRLSDPYDWIGVSVFEVVSP